MDIASMATGFGLVIGLIGVLLIFGTPIVIVLAILSYKTKKARIQSEMACRLAEKGVPIPVEMQITPVASPNADRRRGIILIALGLGLCGFLYVVDPEDTLWGWGIIPLVVGLGYLLAWFIDRHQDAK